MGDETTTAVITVDWQAVENRTDTANEHPDHLKQFIEQKGNVTSRTLKKNGYDEYASTGLSKAVRDNKALNNPNTDGVYPPEYFNRIDLETIWELKQEAYGEDHDITDISNAVNDDVTLADGLQHLVEAAETIDARTRDSVEVNVSRGSHGPDRLGNYQLQVKSNSQTVLNNIDVSETRVEHEEQLQFGDSHSDDVTLIDYYRHERYYSDDAETNTTTGGEYDDMAAEIGFEAANTGAPKPIVESIKSRGVSYERVNEFTALGNNITVYEYTADGKHRFAAEWSVRAGIDMVCHHSLIFSIEPDAEAVKRASEIVNARTSKFE